MTDAGLKHLAALPKLSELYLSGTGVTDTGLKVLTDFKHLNRLWVYNTKVTEAGRAELRAARPGWTIAP